MQRLSWGSEKGADRAEPGLVRWYGQDGLWVGSWQQHAARSGSYLSARSSMITFVLHGAMAVELGPRHDAFELTEGDAMVIHDTTPFHYRMARASHVLVTETGARHGDLGLERIERGRLPRQLRAALRRFDSEPMAIAQAVQSWRPRGRTLALEPIHNTRLMLAVKRKLDSDFREPLKLRELARRFDLDASYLSRAFAKSIGVSPKRYLQALRREHFLRRVLGRDQRACGREESLTALALEAGFGDYSTFCRWLRRELGVAPSELGDDATEACEERAA